jgi:hypothetical protein
MSPFDLPTDARPGRDQMVGQDELGNPVYRTMRGTQYTVPERVSMPAPAMRDRFGMVGEAARGATLGGIFDVVKQLGRGIYEGLEQGVTAPRRALQGQPMTMGDAAATAGMGIVGAAGGAAPAGSLRSGISRTGEPEGIRAFHGSPHDFDRFDMSKIGTGEGNQAFGHGLYFAESEGVARSYRDALSEAPGIRGILPEGQVFNDPNIIAAERLPTPHGVVLEKVFDRFQENASRQGLSRDAIANAIDGTEQEIRNRMVQRMRENPADRQRQIREFGFDRTEKAYSDQLDYASSLRSRIDELEPVPGAGRMYEVDIRANPDELLDWDVPLASQPPAVQERFRSIAPDAPETAQGNRLLLEAYPPPGQEVPGEFLGETATRRLREAGIPGIRYLDADSRAVGGTRNLVVFDENLISIVRKYGIAGAATMLGVTAADVQSALADNMPQSEWESLVVGQ